MTDKKPRINPAEEMQRAAASGALSSRAYIAKFEALDREPIIPMDIDSATARDRQIIALCRKIARVQTAKATDAQVLGLHHAFMAGRL